MEKLYQDSETGCCPRFDPNPWDEKEVSFKDRLFLKDRVMSLFHIPLNFGQVMKRDMEKIQKAGALAPKPLMLSDSSSLWGTDVYIAVDKEVSGAKMERISGLFLTKVFEGEYKNMGKWTKEMTSAKTFTEIPPIPQSHFATTLAMLPLLDDKYHRRLLTYPLLVACLETIDTSCTLKTSFTFAGIHYFSHPIPSWSPSNL